MTASHTQPPGGAVDPDVGGPDADIRRFLPLLAELTREAVGSDSTLASRADDVVRSLLVHTHPGLPGRLPPPVCALRS